MEERLQEALEEIVKLNNRNKELSDTVDFQENAFKNYQKGEEERNRKLIIKKCAANLFSIAAVENAKEHKEIYTERQNAYEDADMLGSGPWGGSMVEFLKDVEEAAEQLLLENQIIKASESVKKDARRQGDYDQANTMCMASLLECLLGTHFFLFFCSFLVPFLTFFLLLQHRTK